MDAWKQPGPANACPAVCSPAPEACGPPGRFWISAEYLYWAIKEDRVPPLITTGPATFPVGFLGNPGTVILFGGGDLERGGDFSGGRVTSGFWLDDCRTCGIEGSAFFLADRTSEFNFNNPVLARPFTNLNAGGVPFSEFAGFPGISAGNIHITNPSKFWGAETNIRKSLCCGCDYRVDLLVGARYLDLEESIGIVETSQVLPGGPFPAQAGSTFVTSDLFGTRNQFYGGQIGVDGNWHRGSWVLDVRAKVAVGTNHEVINIAGNQVGIGPAGNSISTGGLLALSSNIGRSSRDRFAVVPEGAINLGYQVGPHLQVFMGYTYLYWSNVVRPGDQIDTGLDINRIPNFGGLVGTPIAAARPAVTFKDRDFWAQGVNFGVELRW
ncbi:MAG: BBP7 family outer membrane beta-barrel protein [Gemmataceae bacterium]